MHRSDDAGPGGSSYIDGWYGYVAKDLRTLLGRAVRGPFATRFCGGGVLARLPRLALVRARRRRGRSAKKQGADPAQWHADATAERINFTTGHRAGHDALDEPSDVPAGDQLLRPPVICGPQGTLSSDGGKALPVHAGPTPVPPEVLAATAAPVLHHRGPDFKALLAETLERLQAGLPHRERRPPVHRRRVAARSSRRSRTCSRRATGCLRSRRASSASAGRSWRRPTARRVPLTYEWGSPPASTISPEPLPRRRPTSSSSCTPRPRPGSWPTCRRSRRWRKRPARSLSSTRSRASALFRSRPTLGASTWSSPARRRR